MAVILSPLTRLMNQFSFRVKFAVIGILFLIPLIISNMILWSQIHSEITFTDKERLGVEYIPTLRQMAASMAAHRGTTQGLMNGDRSFQSKVMLHKGKVDALLVTLQALDAKLTTQLDSQKGSQQIKARWQGIKNNTRLSPKENFAEHSGLIADVLGHMQHIANASNLMLDPALDSYYLMDSVVSILPVLAENMGQVRGMGAGAIAKGDLAAVPVLELSVLNAKLVQFLKSLEVALDTAIHYNDSLKPSLAQLGQSTVAATHQFIELTERNLLSNQASTVSAGDYFSAGTAAIADCFKLYDKMIPELDRLLTERIDHDWRNLTIILSSFVFVLLLMVVIFVALYRALGSSIDHLSAVATMLAEGDLTSRSELQVKDELGKTSEALNRIANDFGRVVFNIKSTSEILDDLSDDMYQANQKTCDGVLKQESDIDMAATSVNQMTASLQEVSTSTSQAAEAAGQAKDAAENGLGVVKGVVHSIEQLATEVEQAGGVVEKLEQDSASITTILEVIRGIADQTNLLALNAAIEAARAGELGRGFAVVADEVRNLASRTQEATTEIQSMITNLQSGSKDAALVMREGVDLAKTSVTQVSGASEALDEIVRAVDVINNMSSQIAVAAEQQGSVAEEVNRNILNIKAVSAETSQSASLSRESSGRVRSLSAEVKALSNRFIVDEMMVESGWAPPQKLFEWNNSWSVGNQEIDRQHRSLMTLANEYHKTQANKSARGTVARVMSGVVEYTKSHFQYEEYLMEKFKYPDLEPHKKEHAKIVKQVEGYKQRFDRGDDLGNDFSDFLVDWLINHIEKSDKSYSEYIQE